MSDNKLDKKIKLTSVKLTGGDAALIFDAKKNMFDIMIPEDVQYRNKYILEYNLLTAMYIRLNTDPDFAAEQLQYMQSYQEQTQEDTDDGSSDIIISV